MGISRVSLNEPLLWGCTRIGVTRGKAIRTYTDWFYLSEARLSHAGWHLRSKKQAYTGPSHVVLETTLLACSSKEARQCRILRPRSTAIQTNMKRESKHLPGPAVVVRVKSAYGRGRTRYAEPCIFAMRLTRRSKRLENATTQLHPGKPGSSPNAHRNTNGIDQGRTGGNMGLWKFCGKYRGKEDDVG